jgi:OFA family oxalate/formate antiporter-like MFS transporter
VSRRFIVAIAGLFVVLSPGAVYAFSLLSGPLAAAFGFRPQQVSWAFALFSLFIAVGAALGGILCDKRGPQFSAMVGGVLLSVGYALCGTLAIIPGVPTLLLLYLFYGLVAGTGSGMVYISAITAIMRWSKTRRGLAGGFVIMGFGLGTLVYGVIVKAWSGFSSLQDSTKIYMDAYATSVASGRAFNAAHVLLPPNDRNGLMLIFVASGIAFLIITLSAARFIAFPEPALDSSKPTDFTSGQMFADARFYVLWAVLFLNVFGGSMVIGSASAIMSELASVPVAVAAGLYALLAIFNGVGRIAFGALSDRIGRRFTFVAIFIMQAVAFMMLDSLHDIVSISIALGLLLFAYGGGFGTVPAAIADLFGSKNFGAIYGSTLSAWGLAAVLGAYFVNVLKTSGGSYVGMMQPLSVLALVALFFPMIIDPRRKERKLVAGARPNVG